MVTERVISEELINKLTCSLELDLGGMIRNLPLPEISPIRPQASGSSMATLDILPPELLLFVFNSLDSQSLSRLSRTSRSALAAVETFPAYRELLDHAPHVLVALTKTRTIQYHPATLLRRTLYTSECVSCFDFGAFLFLPTCERVCFECLHQNQALRMTTLSNARKCFRLTDRHLKKLPILHSIPGTYGVRLHTSRRRVYRLVSVKQVKQLALEVHGSPEAVASLMPTNPPQGKAARQFYIFKWFHEAPLEAPRCDLSRIPEGSNLVEDDFGGMASIRMPYLSGGNTIDLGRVCKGCRHLDELHSWGLLPTAVLADLAPNVGPRRPLLALGTRLRSRDGFAEHVRTCYGANVLIAGWERDEAG